MKCYLNQDVAQKMHYYVHSVDAEISGIAKSEIIDGDIYITDIKIRKQKCSGARTIIDEEDDMKEAYLMKKAGEDLNKWNVWWHSHHTMGVFWSGTDTGTIKEICGGGAYFISIVTNKDGKYKTRLDIFPKDVSPLKIVSHVLAQDDIETIVLPAVINEERRDELKEYLDEKTEEYDAKITKIEEETQQKIDMLEEYKKAQIKKIEDDYYDKFGDFENELTMMSEDTIIEDEAIKNDVLTEVATKVEIDKPYEFSKDKKYDPKKDVKSFDDYEYDSYLPSYSGYKNYTPQSRDDSDYYDKLFSKKRKVQDMTDEELDEYIIQGYMESDDGYMTQSEIGFKISKEELAEAEDEVEIREYNKSFGRYAPEIGID